MSETVLSSVSVMVADVNFTSVTVAVHMSFGHEPAGALGVVVDTFLKLYEPFRGVGRVPVPPVALKVKL